MRGRSGNETVPSFPDLLPQAIAEGSVGFFMGCGADESLEGEEVSPKESSEMLLCETNAAAYPCVLADEEEQWGVSWSHPSLSSSALLRILLLWVS